MAEDDGKVCTKQFTWCDICRTNHTELKKHVYSKSHRASVDRLLTRFKTKIDEAKEAMTSCSIINGAFENTVMIWCYFCGKEIKKHLVEENLTVCFAGFICHLNSVEHFKKSKTFWWKNKVDACLLNNYLFLEEDYKRFRINVSQAKEEFKDHCAAEYKKTMDQITTMEAERKKLLGNGAWSELCPSSSQVSLHPSVDNASSSTQTSVEAQNIFTGMLPPWLQEEDRDTNFTPDIRPNMEDYKKHLGLLKKRKLPSTRVGANFDRDSKMPSDWLPSFGQVWNNSRRSSSRKRFQSMSKKRNHNNAEAMGHEDELVRPPVNLNKYML